MVEADTWIVVVLKELLDVAVALGWDGLDHVEGEVHFLVFPAEILVNIYWQLDQWADEHDTVPVD